MATATTSVYPKISPLTSIMSWLGIISLILVARNDRIIYFYLVASLLGVLMINSFLFKMLRLSTVSYDFVVYHFVTSLGIAMATLISNLRLAPYHRVSFQHMTSITR